MAARSQTQRRSRADLEAPADPSAAPTAVAGGGSTSAIDRVIHQPVRLAIVSSLAVNDALGFAELKGLLELSDGNLSVHARKLEDAGYVRCDKEFVGRVPRTRYRLTAAGREALQRYLGHMEALITAVRDG